MSINTFFILASRSRSRLSLLKKNKLNFIVIKPTCNEEFYKKKYLKKKYSPKKISLELSKMKAMSVSSENKNKLVIGSDTVIDYKNKMFDKAKNINLARKKIKKLSGKKHSIITSLVAYKNNKLVWSLTEKTTVKLRKLTDSDINKYLKQCGPKILNSVGCYQIEKTGPQIIEEIKGDFFNIMGFPLFPFLRFLINNKNKKNGY